MAKYVWVRNTNGAEYPVVKSAFDPELHTEVEGAEVALDANAQPTLRRDEPQAPPKNAPKVAWVDYAVSQGADPEEAEAANRADLIAEYGTE